MVQVLTPTVNLPSVTPRHGQADNRAMQIAVQASPNIAPNTPVDLRLTATFLDDGVSITQPLTYRIFIGTHAGIAQSLTPDPQPPTPCFRAFPNPTRSSVTFTAPPLNPGTPGPLAPAVSIYASDGRLVRTLFSPNWDLTDGSGRRVAPGVYMVRFASGNETGLARVTVLE
jgi:hypothetical protein